MTSRGAWLALGACVLASLGSAPAPAPSAGLPPIVFVSRRPIGTGPPAGVPGLGSGQRATVPGGRLLLRRADGRIVPLLPSWRFYDVSDPCVSFDGTRIAFAALTRPDSAWRIWAVDANGRHLAAVTRTDRALDLSRYGRAAALFRRYDDLDPCWLPDGRLCFSSNRYPLVAGTTGRRSTRRSVSAAARWRAPPADALSLEPPPGRVRLAVSPRGLAEPVTFPPPPAQMCAPAPLPDGRLVVAYDPNGRGDFGLAVVNRDGTGLEPLVDLRGTLELDPVALAPRPLPPVLGAGLGGPPR